MCACVRHMCVHLFACKQSGLIMIQMILSFSHKKVSIKVNEINSTSRSIGNQTWKDNKEDKEEFKDDKDEEAEEEEEEENNIL